MFCPDCNHHLSPATIPVKGSTVILDYCGYCGGVWTDHAETNFFTLQDLNTLHNVLPHAPKKALTGSHKCPHDNRELTRLEHESVPLGTSVLHCATCGGNWFPYGELARFKKAQKAKVDYFKVWGIPLHSMYAVLLPLFVVAVLSTGMLGAVIGIRNQQNLQSQARDVIGKPIVIKGSAPGEIIISYTTSSSLQSSITYWNNPIEQKTVPVSQEERQSHMIKLEDLITKTTYFYTITVESKDNRTKLTSPLYSFTTQ